MNFCGDKIGATESFPTIYPLVMTNIATENGPFIDDFPIKPSIYQGFSVAMLNSQMVIVMSVGLCYPHEL